MLDLGLEGPYGIQTSQSHAALAFHACRPRRSVFGLPVMSPLCRFAIFWGFVNAITDLTYTAFVVALSLAFNGNNLDNVYTILDIIGSFIYITDLLLQFHIGYVVRWDNESVTIRDGRAVAKYYIRKGTFWVDLIATLPVIGQIALLAAHGGNRHGTQALLLLKLLRLLRVVHLMNVSALS